jgi:hypothetical protein
VHKVEETGTEKCCKVEGTETEEQRSTLEGKGTETGTETCCKVEGTETEEQRSTLEGNKKENRSTLEETEEQSNKKKETETPRPWFQSKIEKYSCSFKYILQLQLTRNYQC